MYIVENCCHHNPPELPSWQWLRAGARGQAESRHRLAYESHLSADHRVTDGAEAAQFMQVLGEYLLNPVGL